MTKQGPPTLWWTVFLLIPAQESFAEKTLLYQNHLDKFVLIRMTKISTA